MENETETRGITRYGQWDEDPYEDWAGAFVRFVLHYAGTDTADAKKATSEWLEQLHDKEELQSADLAEPGDVIFVYDDKEELKAGIVDDVQEEIVRALMGDWDDKVQEKKFSKVDVNVHSIWKHVASDTKEEQPQEPVQDEEQKPEEEPVEEEEKPAEDKNTDTNKEEEQIVTYDFTQEVEAEDGAKIKVSWNAGTFETEDVVFQAKKVELTEEEQKKVQEQLEQDKNYTFRNYDLTFYVRDENMELQKVEPTQPVHVEIEFEGEESKGKNEVFHHDDSGQIETIDQNSEKKDLNHSGKVEFKTDKFSVFTVATLSEYNKYISIYNNEESYEKLVRYADGRFQLDPDQYLRLEENVWVPSSWGTGTISITRDFRLDLYGFVLTNNKTSTLFNVSSGNVEIISSKKPEESSFNGNTINNGVNTSNKTISFNTESNKGITASNVGILVANPGGDVVSVNGGTLTMENVAVAGINNASAVYEKNSTVTLQNCYLVNGKRGLYADGGTVIVKDGNIANNNTSGDYDQAGAAIQARNNAQILLGDEDTNANSSTRLDIQYNRFSQAVSRTYGGAIHLRGSELTIKNTIIQNNEISGTDWVCGGAIAALCSNRNNDSEDGNEWTWGTPSKISIYEPAVIDGNKAQAGGGGIFLQGPRIGGQAPTEFDNASKLFMYGGTISNNTATNNEGGGIHQAASYRSYAYLFTGEISGNKTTTSQHWGGGGIFVGEDSYMLLPNGASVYANSAEGLGGGVAACSTGNIIFDENVVMAQNNSNANAWTGPATQKPYDRTLAQGHEGFSKPGDARDFFSALYASVAGELPNGLGGNNWSGSVDYNIVSGVNAGTLTANQIMGLVNNAPKDVQDNALTRSTLKIFNNTSSKHGGGILVNGYMIGGDVEYLPSGPTINFQADKCLLDKDGKEVGLEDNVFEFELLENNVIIAEGKNNSDGLITFSPPVVYMPDMSQINPKQTTSWDTSATFVMKEKQKSGSSFEMSQASYTISLKYRTTLTFVLTYPVYNQQGAWQKNVDVYRADSVIVDNSLIVTDTAGNRVKAELRQADPNISDEHQYSFNNKILHINPGEADFINKKIPQKDITVKKIWQDQTGNTFVPAEGITAEFELYRKENGASEYEDKPHKTVTLPVKGQWEYTFEDLDSRYEYEVREKNTDPLYEVSHSVSNVTNTSVWVKANEIVNGKSYLIGSKDSSGNIVLLTRDSSSDQSDVMRFGTDNKIVLNNDTGTTIIIDGKTYTDSFEYNLSSTIDPSYTAVEVQFPGQSGYALRNSTGSLYTRAEEWETGNKSGLMLTDWSGLTQSNRAVSVNSDGIISQYLNGNEKQYVFDVGNGWFSSTSKTISNYNHAFLYEQKTYPKEDPTHSAWTFVNKRRSDYNLIINKVDGESGIPLENVKFKLFATDNKNVYFNYKDGTYTVSESGQTEMITNTDGKISISGLQPGTYYLREISALAGYVIPDDPIEVVIDSDHDVVDGEDMVINKTIKNHMVYELPETGSAGTKIYTATGTILLLTGTGLYRYKRRRNRKGGEAH